ncbi:MAG: helix-turn-helix domain-containing protein [Alphaproteobacteria bacterium]|nr:helix-turn-helix domain-containing protein [Alphaproteobacteria bacterium]
MDFNRKLSVMLYDIDRADNLLLGAIGEALTESGALYCLDCSQIGETLIDAGESARYALFPTGGALLSGQIVFEDGATIEAALIGREGVVLSSAAMHPAPSIARISVLHGGHIVAAPLSVMRRACERAEHVRLAVSQYCDGVVRALMRATACASTHTLEQRVARRLLSIHARTQQTAIATTQEHLAGLFGVGRSYMNRILSVWRAQGVILRSRGALHIQNLRALQRLACACGDDFQIAGPAPATVFAPNGAGPLVVRE